MKILSFAKISTYSLIAGAAALFVAGTAHAQDATSRAKQCESVIEQKIRADHSDATNINFHGVSHTDEGKHDSWIHGEVGFQTGNGTQQWGASLRCDIDPTNGQIADAKYKVALGFPKSVKAKAATPAKSGTPGKPTAAAPGPSTDASLKKTCQDAIAQKIRADHADMTNLAFSEHDMGITSQGPKNSWVHGEMSFQTGAQKWAGSLRCDINPTNMKVTDASYKTVAPKVTKIVPPAKATVKH